MLMGRVRLVLSHTNPRSQALRSSLKRFKCYHRAVKLYSMARACLESLALTSIHLLMDRRCHSLNCSTYKLSARTAWQNLRSSKKKTFSVVFCKSCLATTLSASLQISSSFYWQIERNHKSHFALTLSPHQTLWAQPPTSHYWTPKSKQRTKVRSSPSLDQQY